MSINQYALTSREAVRQYRLANGEVLDTTTEANTLIDFIIEAVSTRFESYCDRKFKTRSHTEYFDGDGRSIIYPANYPITVVTGINDDSEWSWDSDTVISGTEYRISNDSNSIVFKGTAVRLGNYTQNVKVEYVAGYTTIPYDLKHACNIEVLRSFDNMNDSGVFNKTSMDTSLSFITEPFLPTTLSVLDIYRRRTAY